MSPGRLSGEGDLVRITAETGNVFPHPAEGRYLVFQSQIDDAMIYIVKITECAEPIRNGHHNDITFFGKQGAVISRFFSAYGQIGSSVNPHQYRTCALPGRCIDAQEMAILRLRKLIMAAHQETQAERILGTSGKGPTIFHGSGKRFKDRIFEPPRPGISNVMVSFYQLVNNRLRYVNYKYRDKY